MAASHDLKDVPPNHAPAKSDALYAKAKAIVKTQYELLATQNGPIETSLALVLKNKTELERMVRGLHLQAKSLSAVIAKLYSKQKELQLLKGKWVETESDEKESLQQTISRLIFLEDQAKQIRKIASFNMNPPKEFMELIFPKYWLSFAKDMPYETSDLTLDSEIKWNFFKDLSFDYEIEKFSALTASWFQIRQKIIEGNTLKLSMCEKELARTSLEMKEAGKKLREALLLLGDQNDEIMKLKQADVKQLNHPKNNFNPDELSQAIIVLKKKIAVSYFLIKRLKRKFSKVPLFAERTELEQWRDDLRWKLTLANNNMSIAININTKIGFLKFGFVEILSLFSGRFLRQKELIKSQNKSNEILRNKCLATIKEIEESKSDLTTPYQSSRLSMNKQILAGITDLEKPFKEGLQMLTEEYREFLKTALPAIFTAMKYSLKVKRLQKNIIADKKLIGHLESQIRALKVSDKYKAQYFKKLKLFDPATPAKGVSAKMNDAKKDPAPKRR